MYVDIFEHLPAAWPPTGDARPFLGFDLAYPAGDLYSAVKNGLHPPHPAPELIRMYGAHLNAYGLFRDPALLVAYLAAFRQEACSEANMDFWTYAVYSAPEI